MYESDSDDSTQDDGNKPKTKKRILGDVAIDVAEQLPGAPRYPHMYTQRYLPAIAVSRAMFEETNDPADSLENEQLAQESFTLQLVLEMYKSWIESKLKKFVAAPPQINNWKSFADAWELVKKKTEAARKKHRARRQAR